MKRSKRKLLYRDMPKNYEGLVEMYTPRLIHNDKEFERAYHFLVQLAVQNKLNGAQTDYLEILTLLIERYDSDQPDQHRRTTVLNRLKCLINGAALNAVDLDRLLGKPGLGARLLAGKAKLTKTNAAALAAHFKLDLSYFM